MQYLKHRGFMLPSYTHTHTPTRTHTCTPTNKNIFMQIHIYDKYNT